MKRTLIFYLMLLIVFFPGLTKAAGTLPKEIENFARHEIRFDSSRRIHDGK